MLIQWKALRKVMEQVLSNHSQKSLEQRRSRSRLRHRLMTYDSGVDRAIQVHLQHHKVMRLVLELRSRYRLLMQEGHRRRVLDEMEDDLSGCPTILDRLHRNRMVQLQQGQEHRNRIRYRLMKGELSCYRANLVRHRKMQ